MIGPHLDLVDRVQIFKPSKLLATDCDLELTSSGNPWVSRAGLKLSVGRPASEIIGKIQRQVFGSIQYLLTQAEP